MPADFASSPPVSANEDGMRPKLPWYSWFPSDFLSSTRGWPICAKGLYREILDVQWDREALPADPREIRKIIGASTADWRHWFAFVEVKFPIGDDGLRRNRRLRDLRARAIGKSAMRVEIGRRGGSTTAERRKAASP